MAQSGTCARAVSMVSGVGCRSEDWEPMRTEPVGNLQVWTVGSSCTGGACSGLLIQPLAVLHKHTLLQRQRDCLILGSTPSPTWFPRACRTSWGIRELTSSHQRTPTWVRAGSQREPSSSFLLPHTLRARAVPALRTVIRTGTSNSLAEY